MTTEALYTPEILGLTTRLADYPWDDTLLLQTDARSRSCGSALSLALAVDGDGRIVRVALKMSACAIGQAAAAIFAEGATSLNAAEIDAAHASIAKWLAGDGPMPDWPGLSAIAPARDHPGRHAAIMLAWQAAHRLLPTA